VITFHPRNGLAIENTELDRCPALTRDAIWVDLCDPTSEEEQALESALGLDLPTREEMQQIETSNRLFKRNELLFMTATLIAKAESQEPESCAVTFIYDAERLVTIRYADLQPFRKFRARRDEHPQDYASAASVLGGLLDASVDRIADLLELAGGGVDKLSRQVFRPARERRRAEQALALSERGFRGILRKLGHTSELVSRARESLVTLARVIAFVRESCGEPGSELESHLKTQSRDVTALSDHAAFLAGKISFLLDATLGLINVEQNVIIRVFTIAAVFFLPPTVIGTIYGMNFEHMPELRWQLGYPFALLLMLLSGIGPYVWLKRRGWF